MDPMVSRRIDFWRQNLHDHSPSLQHRHESYALRACHLAVDAARVGTYGVGALLFDGAGRVIVEGHNRVRVGGFQSDLHAEMVVMNAYEATGRPREEARECTLVTSLEPCPMCMARLIVAGGAPFSSPSATLITTVPLVATPSSGVQVTAPS